MPTLNLNEPHTFGGGVFAVFDNFGALTQTSNTSTGFVLEGADSTVTFEGSGLTYTNVFGIDVFSGGTVTDLAITSGANTIFNVENFNLDGADFFAAAQAEIFETDTAAFETLLLNNDWIVNGSSGRDNFPENALSSDGVPIQFDGDDIFNLGGGKDRAFLADGDDVANGGKGNDRLWGGNGNDELSGGKGNDRIWGDKGNDTLIGGTGNDDLYGDKGSDQLDGGADNDLLVGGKGNDTLTGGGGADIFVFKGNFGDDIVTDFDSAVDSIGGSGAGEGSGLNIEQLNDQAPGTDVADYLVTLAGGTILFEDASGTDLINYFFVVG